MQCDSIYMTFWKSKTVGIENGSVEMKKGVDQKETWGYNGG